MINANLKIKNAIYRWFWDPRKLPENTGWLPCNVRQEEKENPTLSPTLLFR